MDAVWGWSDGAVTALRSAGGGKFRFQYITDVSTEWIEMCLCGIRMGSARC